MGGVDSDAHTGVDTEPVPPPPQHESDADLRIPEAGERFLYIPSVGLQALVVVDAITLAIDLVDVGVAPIIARALPDNRGAVVVNAGSDDVAIVRHGADPGSFDVTYLDVLPDNNRMTLSPDGAWAFLWFDHRSDQGGGWAAYRM